ncbi:MAG TPA: Rpn family recombination-promoting nuclease/putative transposase [Pirellulales bacterium]
MKTQTDPKVDYAFKHVFGREESKPALKSLVGAVLQSAGEPGIASLELLNPFNAKDTEDDKLSVVDIKARDESGRQFFVEMQMLASADFLQRVLYYWACLYRDQLHESENYPILRPTMAVCFVDTPLFPDLVDYHHIFELRERRRQRLFTDQMALHILELPKFHKALDELTTDLDRWLYFLRHGAELNAKAPPAALNLAEVLWAIGDLFMISRIDPERELYEARLKARRDEVARQKYSREEGLRVGRAEGREEGRAEILRQLIQPLQKTLGREVTPSEDLQSLSPEELEKAWTELQADLP